MDDCVAKGAISFAALEAFSKKQGPYLKKDITWAAQTQVGHWMSVIGEWKTMLGADWDEDLRGQQHDLCGAPEQHAVQRAGAVLRAGGDQRPADADRDHLVHDDAATTCSNSLTRIIADRSVGSLFFGNYHLMDYELMGGDARAAIIAESEKRGMKPFLPPAVPFGSHQWPTLITPGPGPTSLADLP